MLCLNNEKFVLASRNKKKTAELKKILYDEGIDVQLLSLDDIGYDGEIDECGESFEENSVIKASVPASLGYIGIADDSGLCVDALDGRPGIYSARYSGGDDKDNNKKLLGELDGVPMSERGGSFVCAISCVFPDGERIVCRGSVEGKILTDEHGDGGFGYDPLFFYEPAGLTFAEMGTVEKNKVSHRHNAIKQLAEKLKEKYNA